MRSVLASAALSAFTYGTLSSAGAVQNCPTTGVCYSVAVPQTSASSGSGDIYFQIQAPTTYSWVALGQGSQMADSNMFVMYQDGAGNVTISPRAGTNHVTPSEDTSSTAAKLTLLAGSGVSGSTMTANVKCSNCQSWTTGGTMSFSSSTSGWIAAWKSGKSLATTNKNAAISQHDQTDSWQFDLTQATVTSDVNPFVASSTDNTTTSGGDGSSSGNGGNGSNGGSSSGSSGSSTGSTSSSGVVQNTSAQTTTRLINAHGLIMSIVFVIMYPLGSILMPLMGKWMLHAAWQMVTFILMWAGFGIGIVVSQKTYINFTATHTVFGTVIVCLMILQPALGFLHHSHYVKHQRRGPVSYAHIIYGRILMMLGVINGGLGLQLASAGMNLVTAYAVISAIMGVLYIGIKAISSFRKRSRGGLESGKGMRLSGSSRNKEPFSPPSQDYEMPMRPHGSSNRGRNGA